VQPTQRIKMAEVVTRLMQLVRSNWSADFHLFSKPTQRSVTILPSTSPPTPDTAMTTSPNLQLSMSLSCKQSTPLESSAHAVPTIRNDVSLYASSSTLADTQNEANETANAVLAELPRFHIDDCDSKGFAVIIPSDVSVSDNFHVVLHHPTADFRVVLSHVIKFGNDLVVTFDPSRGDRLFAHGYKHVLKLVKNTRSEVHVLVYVLDGDHVVGRSRIGAVIQWHTDLDTFDIVQFFIVHSVDQEKEEGKQYEQGEMMNRWNIQNRENMKNVKESNKPRFWITLPLDWDKVLKDASSP